MMNLSWLIYNIFNVSLICLSLLFSNVFGLYLKNSTENQTEKTENEDWDVASRSIGLNRNFMWSGSKINGEWIIKVPYKNDLEPEVNKLFLNMVKAFQENSCIRWVPRTNERQFVLINSHPPNNWPAGRCRASIGKSYAKTYLYLSQRCLGLSGNDQPRTYNLAHEMLHSLNFVHEHQRKDRDCYVHISGNLQRNDFENYGIYKNQPTDLSFPFDEESIMQYPDPNIRSKFNKRLGPRSDFPNEMDWNKVNHHYCWGKHYCKQQNSVANERCQRHKQIVAQCLKQG